MTRDRRIERNGTVYHSGQIRGQGPRIRRERMVRWKVEGQRKECSGVSEHGNIPRHSRSVPKYTQ